MSDAACDFETVPFDALPAPDAGEAHVWRIALDASETRMAELATVLDPAETARAERFRSAHAKRCFIVARATLRLMLARMLGRDARALAFAEGTEGKPSLRDPGGLEFNLAHSGDYALIAFTNGVAVGVDIEQIRDAPQLEQLAKSHFAAGEIANLMQIDPAQRNDAFHACWTRKEAYVKALGLGLFAPLSTFEVSFAPGEPANLLSAAGDDARAWTLAGFRPADGYWGALACRRTPLRIRMMQNG